MSVVIDLWRQAPWWRRTTLIALVCTVLAFAPSRRVAPERSGYVPPPAATDAAATDAAATASRPAPASPTRATPTEPSATAPIYRAPAGSGALAPSRNFRVEDLPPPPTPKDDTPIFTGRDPRLLPSRPTTPATDPKATDNP